MKHSYDELDIKIYQDWLTQIIRFALLILESVA